MQVVINFWSVANRIHPYHAIKPGWIVTFNLIKLNLAKTTHINIVGDDVFTDNLEGWLSCLGTFTALLFSLHLNLSNYLAF